VTVLMYVVSDDVATTPRHFVEGCLFALDTFEFETDSADADAGTGGKKKGKKHGKKSGFFGKIKASLGKAAKKMLGKLKEVMDKVNDGLAGTGPSGSGTLTRFEASIHGVEMISFKDLLQQNGLKVMRDDGKYNYFSSPDTPGIEPYVVYKVDVLIGPFREVAGNRARIPYSACEEVPEPLNVAADSDSESDPPKSVTLLKLNPVPAGKRTSISAAGGGGGGGVSSQQMAAIDAKMKALDSKMKTMIMPEETFGGFGLTDRELGLTVEYN